MLSQLLWKFQPRKCGGPTRVKHWWKIDNSAFAGMTFMVLAMPDPAYAWNEEQVVTAVETQLVIELDAKQDRRIQPNGKLFFQASGQILNPTDQVQEIPTLLVILRDDQHRIVYQWQMDPPQKRLAAGSSIKFSEAKLDTPESASLLEVGWSSQPWHDTDSWSVENREKVKAARAEYEASYQRYLTIRKAAISSAKQKMQNENK